MSLTEIREAWYGNHYKELGIEITKTENNQAVPDTTTQKVATSPSPILIGWVCPKCGAGNAPFNPRCPCVGWPELKVTC